MRVLLPHTLQRSSIGITSMLLTLIIAILSGSPVMAANIAQGYISNSPDIRIGMAVSLGSEDNTVVLSNISNASRFAGIVTTTENNLVTLTHTSSNVTVTTSGKATAYVSDIGGRPEVGDLISVSDLTGILIKASSKDATIVGRIVAEYNDEETSSVIVTTESGGSTKANIYPYKVELTPNAVANKTTSTDNFLQVISQGLVGRTVSNWQVITVLIIFAMLMVVEGSVVYGAIHGSIISVGRNPLARDALFRQLLQAVLVALFVFVFGIAIIYSVLQL